MPQGFQFSNQELPQGHHSTREFDTPQAKTNLMGKTFMYFAIALLITLVVNIGTSLLFKYAFPILDADVLNDANATIYIGTLIGSGIVVLVMTLVLNFAFLGAKSKRNVFLVPYIIYAIAMGVFLACFTLFIEWYVLAISLGITVVSFGAMALIGATAKKGINVLAIVAMALGVSLLLVSLFWFIWYLIFPALFEWLYVGISLGYLVFMYLITIIDVYRIKKASDQGVTSNNLALYFAYQLYVDFIYILIRVILLVLKFTRKN